MDTLEALKFNAPQVERKSYTSKICLNSYRASPNQQENLADISLVSIKRSEVPDPNSPRY
jgi:hypothetical protein